ncbi:MAG: efflux RND transporter periplasmic adaptor subunit [Isosphaeraceae bacterium]
MSASMFIGRILLPGIGLVVAGVLGWQALHGGMETKLPLMLASLTGSTSPGQVVGPDGANPGTGRKPDAPPLILAEGHVVACPDAEVVVGAEMAGTVTKVSVQEKSVVHQGDLLISFRGDEIRASAQEAVARVNEADAELNLIEQEKLHLNRLAEKPPGPDEAGDKLKARWNAASARRAAAVAVYKRIEAEFARTHLRSPIDGVVISRAVNPGETVNLGAPLLRIVDLKRLRVEAEIDEYDIPRCAVGAGATITAPGHSGQSWPGTIEEIADALIPRRIRPEDPGRPTDTRVLPVRISLGQSTPLKLGQRVEVKIAEVVKAEDAQPVAQISSSSKVVPERK